VRYQRYPITATARYGAKNKYMIPVFIPAAMPISPLLTLFSRVALHIAHWAFADTVITNSKNTDVNFFIFICNKD